MNAFATLITCSLLMLTLSLHKLAKCFGLNSFTTSPFYTRLFRRLLTASFAIYGKPWQSDLNVEDVLGRKVTINRHKDVNFDAVNNKVILVTGAAGSIGSELVRQICLYSPRKVILLDNNESGLYDIILKLRTEVGDKVDYVAVLADVTNAVNIAHIFKQYKPDVILHAAAYKHVPLLEEYPLESIRVNVGGTWTLAHLAVEHNVERFVLISTDKAVDPSCVMGASKRICELLIQSLAQQANSKTKFTAVRFGNVLASRGSVIPTFQKQIASGGPVTVTHKEMTRYFMTIPEAVSLVIHATCMTQGGEIFMLKMGEPVNITSLAERLIRLHGLQPYKEIDIKFTGIREGEKLHEQLHYGSEIEMSTIHPSIVNLRTQESRLSATVFLNFVQNLIAWTPLVEEQVPYLYLAVLREAAQIVNRVA